MYRPMRTIPFLLKYESVLIFKSKKDYSLVRIVPAFTPTQKIWTTDHHQS